MPGTARDALHAVSRLLAAGVEAGAPDAVRAALVREARDFFGVGSAALLELGAGGAEVVAEEPAPLPAARGLLLLPLHRRDGVAHVLALADEGPRELDAEAAEVAAAFAAAAAASLDHLGLAGQLAERVAQQSALARAAEALSESLDLPRVLGLIAREATGIVGADVGAVWRGNGRDGVTVEAVHGFPPELVGHRLEPGEGIAGRVALLGEPVVANDYRRIAPPGSQFAGVECVLGVPMRWDGELRGVLAVGYGRPHTGTGADVRLLETFAELASVACRNARAHAGLAQAARTDGLTGCLNQAALHEAIGREIERSRRTGQGLSLVLIDLDDFKQVNERHGHQVGDELLRRVGHALQASLRPYDHVGRYGGDEFAIVAVDAGEAEAHEVARRAIARLDGVAGDFGGGWPLDPERGSATAGVAEWHPTLGVTELVAQADRALLFGKHESRPGEVVAASSLPDSFRPGRFRRRGPEPSRERGAGGAQETWTGPGRLELERLRKRSRQLARAHALGARLAALEGAEQMTECAAEDVRHALAAERCALLRADDRRAQAPPDGIVARCLRERRAIVGHSGSGSQVCAPVSVGDELWGAIAVEHEEADAFDEDDARFVQAVADNLGMALRWAGRLGGGRGSG